MSRPDPPAALGEAHGVRPLAASDVQRGARRQVGDFRHECGVRLSAPDPFGGGVPLVPFLLVHGRQRARSGAPAGRTTARAVLSTHVHWMRTIQSAPRGRASRARRPRPPVAGTRDPRLGFAAGAAAAGQFAASGLVIFSGIVAAERLGLAPMDRGLVIAGFGMAGIIAGPVFGRLSDRVGAVRLGVPMTVLLAVCAGASMVAPSPGFLIACLWVGGVAAAMLRLLDQHEGDAHLTQQRERGHVPDDGCPVLRHRVRAAGPAVVPAVGVGRGGPVPRGGGGLNRAGLAGRASSLRGLTFPGTAPAGSDDR